ncbi:MAG: type II toxin-antitoxin system RelE/ParE family toxin [Methylobacteriaceae bacterium]|nr:type II toxin-antitoxin system RelE/ParE family toxin [Methylobacteriaceae bacterium]
MPSRVLFSDAAQIDLDNLFEWLAERAGVEIRARLYPANQTEMYCAAALPERGTRRDEILPGLRTIGFERRVTIAFMVEDGNVIILAVAYGGRQLNADQLRRHH